ncbi:hypothetical protein SYNPS1DRAFT_21014 [Syncephalis pseudoplumigaleata]|uniref:Cytochrome b mRNA-processing protein 4 n=1 Tax=Syncephalis pseudoplumigaleata TaxID=1712513 RepID=A0A4P9Z4G7_9FUNG|nr:hypothetical protein SYNPS1DRAFT_21014 [Syncephalis pseudoplumigaleata]|eukprot:RKP27477.1 hypothetical protein SYNPS1DRAFT_21014 [Syncephalis pseudoplumigaleata]
MSGRPSYLKGFLYSTAIMMVGYGFYKYTVPNRDEFVATLPEEVKQQLVQHKDEQRRRNQYILDQIRQNAASDRPAWDVRVYPTASDDAAAAAQPSQSQSS